MKTETVEEYQARMDKVDLFLAEELDLCCKNSNYAYAHGDAYNGRHYSDRAQEIRRVLVSHGVLLQSAI